MEEEGIDVSSETIFLKQKEEDWQQMLAQGQCSSHTHTHTHIQVLAPTMTNRIKIPSMQRMYSFMLPLYVCTQVWFCKAFMCLFFSIYGFSAVASVSPLQKADRLSPQDMRIIVV